MRIDSKTQNHHILQQFVAKIPYALSGIVTVTFSNM